MKPEAALHRLKGAFQGLDKHLDRGTDIAPEDLRRWARRQEDFIDRALDREGES